MAPLPYLPKSVADTTESWGWTNTVTSALDDLQQAGSELMQPVGRHVADVMPRPAPQPAPEVRLPEIRPFELPSPESWGFGQRRQPPGVPDTGFELTPATSPDARVARSPAGGGAAALPAAAAGGPAPTDFNEYLRVAAARAGVDPEQVAKVMAKEGPTGWGSVGRFDTGTSYGPLQLHYAGGSNPKAGMGDRFTAATGIDLRTVDPKTPEGIAAHQAAVDFAMGELVKRGDWSEWYGADPALGSRFTKVNRVQPAQPAPPVAQPLAPTPTQRAAEGRAASGETGGAPRFGTYTAETLTPNQYTEGQAQGLSAEEALAVCGPAAAVAFARANGRNPTLREAKELAQNLGLWNVNVGMKGPASQVQLLEKMGVPSRLEQGTDWARVAQEVQAGRPVIVDTPLHYYTVTGFDPATGQFEFGQSAGVLRASKGRTRYRPEEIPNLGMGSPRATIYLGGR